MNKRTLKLKGFTLLETVIYIALFSIIMSGAFGAAYALMEGAERHFKSLSIEQEGTFINRKLNWELTNAQSVTRLSASSVQIEPSSVVFAQDANVMKISRAGGALQNLSSSAHKVEGTQFVVTSSSGGRPASLRVTYNIDGRPFSFAKYLRQ